MVGLTRWTTSGLDDLVPAPFTSISSKCTLTMTIFFDVTSVFLLCPPSHGNVTVSLLRIVWSLSSFPAIVADEMTQSFVLLLETGPGCSVLNSVFLDLGDGLSTPRPVRIDLRTYQTFVEELFKTASRRLANFLGEWNGVFDVQPEAILLSEQWSLLHRKT